LYRSGKNNTTLNSFESPSPDFKANSPVLRV
jgi:hypothetical protein